MSSTLYHILRPHKRIVFGIADAVLTAFCIYGAFLIRFEGILPAEYHGRFWWYLLIPISLNLLSLSVHRLYSFSWDFVSLHELTLLIKALTYSNIIFGIIVFVARENTALFTAFPRSVVFINYPLNILLIGALRMAKRVWIEAFQRKFFSGIQKTLLVGAGQEGDQFLRSLIKHKDSVYFPVGIVDNRPEKQKISLQGVKVLGQIKDIPYLADEHGIEHIIIALTTAKSQLIQEAVSYARESNIKHIKIIPDTYEILSGRKQLNDVRELQVEDLLGRTPANIDTKSIREFLKDKIVCVTGAAGSIGSELARQIVAFTPAKMLLLDFNESGLFDLADELNSLSPGQPMEFLIANINDREKIFKIFEHKRPHVIFHAAAYKHVPFMEDFPEEAIRVNVLGTLNLAEAAFKYKTDTFVLVSTDKAIHPISVMGKTKRAAELVIQSLNQDNRTKFIAVRFGNVIGSRGSVVPLFEKRIKQRAPLTITHPDMTRYFMTIHEAALLITEAGTVGKGGEIFMLDMGKPLKIIDLARQMIKLSGLEPDIDIPIVFGKPRPGEKVFEEIFSDDEKRLGTTQWDKIFITKSEKTYPYNLANQEMMRLEKALAVSLIDAQKILDGFIK